MEHNLESRSRVVTDFLLDECRHHLRHHLAWNLDRMGKTLRLPEGTLVRALSWNAGSWTVGHTPVFAEGDKVECEGVLHLVEGVLPVRVRGELVRQELKLGAVVP